MSKFKWLPMLLIAVFALACAPQASPTTALPTTVSQPTNAPTADKVTLVLGA